MPGKNTALSIYCDDVLVNWIDSLPGRSRNEKVVDLLYRAREHQIQTGDFCTLEGLTTRVNGLVRMLVEKNQITQTEARNLLIEHAASAERLVSEKTKRLVR